MCYNVYIKIRGEHMRSSLKSVMRLIDVATEKLSPEDAFLSDLKRSIELTDEKNRRLPSQTYKPSGMNCIRSMYYQVTGQEPDPANSAYRMVGICNSGSDIHQRIQQAVLDMKDNGIDCEYINVAEFVRSRGLDYLDIVKEPDFEHGDYETKLYHKTLNMSFLCDGIIKYQSKYYVLEIKSESSSKWTYREGVEPKHEHQGIAYPMVFNLSDTIFLYVNRDNLDMKTFMFHVTDKMKQDLVGLIEECDGYVKRMITPPKPELPKGVCSYCSYKERCRKED